MIEILPVRLLTSEDGPIFGSLNVSLALLQRSGLPVGPGIVVTAPKLKLRTTLESYDFGTKELFEQTLVLVKKEITAIPVPAILIQETAKHNIFYANGEQIKSVKNLWLYLLDVWLNQVKTRLWNNGFYAGITDNLEPQLVFFTNKLMAAGTAYFDPMQEDIVIRAKLGQLEPRDQRQVFDLVQTANKKLFIPHEYGWILDQGIKLVKVSPYTPLFNPANLIETSLPEDLQEKVGRKKNRSAVKVLLDLSTGLTLDKEVEGVYIAAEKIFNLEKPRDSFDDLVFRLVEGAMAFPQSPVFFKLADQSEGMGQVRGALRLIHQQSLLKPLLEALDFARHKKGLTNVHIVVPFIRHTQELSQVKRELLVKKLTRKSSLEIWMEAAVPENIINLEKYLLVGIDGVVLNLDELVAYLNGFDHVKEELSFYKNEVDGLIKFLADGIKVLHQNKIPFIAYGSLSLNPKMLEFLVGIGIEAIVVDRFWSHSAYELLYQTEKRLIIKRSM